MDPGRLHRAAARHAGRRHPVLLDQPPLRRDRPVALRQRHLLPRRGEVGRGRGLLVHLLSRSAALRGLPLDRLQRHRRAGPRELRVPPLPGPGRTGGAPRGGRRQHPGGPVRLRTHRDHSRRGLLGAGPHRRRHVPRAVRRAVLPPVADTAPPVRCRGIRGHEDHAEGRPGLGVDQVHRLQGGDGARLPDPVHDPHPTVHGQRPPLHRSRSRALVPVLRHARPLPDLGSHSRPSAAGCRRDRADPQRLHRAVGGGADQISRSLDSLDRDLRDVFAEEDAS